MTATIRFRTSVGSGDISYAGMRSNRLSRNQRCIAHRIRTSKLSSGATTIARHQLNRVFKLIRSAALITCKLGGLVLASSLRRADSPSPPAPLPQTSLYSSQHFRVLKLLDAHDRSESTKRLVRGRGEPFWGKSLLDLAVLGSRPVANNWQPLHSLQGSALERNAPEAPPQAEHVRAAPRFTVTFRGRATDCE